MKCVKPMLPDIRDAGYDSFGIGIPTVSSALTALQPGPTARSLLEPASL